MKIRISFFIFLFAPTLIFGQWNLVPNSGFEDSAACQNNPGTYQPLAWYSPTDGTPDYFLESQMLGGCIDSFPSRWGSYSFVSQSGYQLPNSGKGYVGFIYDQFSENIGVQLLDTLISNRNYEVSCYVSLADNRAARTIDLIQFEFTPIKLKSYSSEGDFGSFAAFVPDCGNQPGNFIIDTSGWVLIRDTFTAVGGEIFMTVGNFDVLATQYYILDTSAINWGYFYFDDFDVHCIDCIADTFEPPVYSGLVVTPNIGSGSITLSGNFPEGTKFEVYDMLGQLVYYNELQNGNQTQQIFLQLAEGVYSYRVVSNNNVLKADKLVVVR